jgi:hypothetical protein
MRLGGGADQATTAAKLMRLPPAQPINAATAGQAAIDDDPTT